MSQISMSNESIPGMANIEFIQGNDGVSVPPDPATHIIFVLGDHTSGVGVTNTAPYTETIAIATATDSQLGVNTIADPSTVVTGTDNQSAVTSLGVATKLGSQTQYGIPYGGGTTLALNWLGVATDGQIPIGSTGAAPVLANITSMNGSVTVTNGPGTIDLSASDTNNFMAVSTNQSLIPYTSYVCISPGFMLLMALPAVAPAGSIIQITLDGATSFEITQGAGQSIQLGNDNTTPGVFGSITSSQQGDSITLLCSVANLRWNAVNFVGNLIVI